MTGHDSPSKTDEGPSLLGFSLTSPDLVVCGSSPVIPSRKHGDSPDLVVCGSSPVIPSRKHGDSFDFLDGKILSMELSLENGIEGSPASDTHKTPTVRFSTVCQIFQREISPESSFELIPPALCTNPGDAELMKLGGGMNAMTNNDLPRDEGEIDVESDYEKLKENYERQAKELIVMRKELEERQIENQIKTRECQDACKTLKELREELMRKSMHVGSLAFAIEGQVKEKSRWFYALNDLSRKLKIIKIEHIRLSDEASKYKKCLVEVNELRFTVQSKVKQQMDRHEDLKIKFSQGEKERKELYNKVLELKGNIRVFCRCRPLNDKEIVAGDSAGIDFDSAKDGELTVMSNGNPKRTFKFDAVFGPQANQADVFEDTAPFATSVLDGYNVCIFAYGQTGTGKTFTMEGSEYARGVNFRTLEELFRIMKERQNTCRYDMSVSVLEVYNEQIRDLLAGGTQTKRLEIRQAGEGMHNVPGLVEAPVSNMSEVWEVLQTGSKARVVSSTNSNEHSSRSHCIHCVMVKGENLLNGECTKSKLWLVDLAGSERVGKAEVYGERLKETQNINRSLSALGDVISALATKSPHIPFRNSKLTHLLQDSLGGDSKALMFVQISPNSNDMSETLCSLNFASRVKGIELGTARKQLDATEFIRYKQMLEKTKQETKAKDLQLNRLEETVDGLEMKLKEKDLKNKTLQDKIKELESQLLIERKLARQHVDAKIAEQHNNNNQHDDLNTFLRPPLANRSIINLNETSAFKTPMPLPQADGFPKYSEKENNPDMSELLKLPKRTGRASLCMTTRWIPPAPSARRSTMIPFQIPPLCHKDKKEEGLAEETKCTSPKTVRNNTKLSSILRRSVQKKGQKKSPMQQQMMRRGGVRVSIGSRGRMGYKNGGRRTGTREIQQKQNHKEKERGWNV